MGDRPYLPRSGKVVVAQRVDPIYAEIDALDEATAEQVFWHHKWDYTDGCKPRCDNCQSPRYSRIATRRRFNCADCGHEYTSRSRTVFASSKLSYKQLLKAATLADDENLTRRRVRDVVGVSESGASPILARIRLIRAMGTVRTPALQKTAKR